MTLLAPAKINLGLRILRKRSDGFHDLETVFLRIGWNDEIRFDSAPSDTMTCSNPSLPVDEDNLCLQAVKAVRSAGGAATGGLHVHLEKNLPFGAGLGGGSSDAATCLQAANDHLKAGLDESRLHELAAELGSDVPFFLMESGIALGTGRGEVLRAMPFPEALKDTWMVVAVPQVHISTAEAYRGIRPNDREEGALPGLVAEGSLAQWRQGLVNDFEAHLFESHPQLARLKSDLREAGADYAAMSGSGSAVFGVFTGEQEAFDVAQSFGSEMRTWVGRSDAGVN